MQPCTSKSVRQATIVCLVALLLSAALFVAFRENWLGPEVQGKRLAAWAHELNFSDEMDVQIPVSAEIQARHDAAVKAIRELGDKALPFALKCCAVQESTLELKLLGWFGEFRSEIHRTPVQDQWQKGLDIFRVLGTNASPAIPDLIGFLMQPESAAANNASSAFRYVGTASIPPLLVALTNANKDVARLAAFSLSHFETNSLAATPVLLAQINARDSLADTAMYALLKINPDPSVVAPALATYLRTQPNLPYSLEIFSWLEKNGTNAAPVTPALEEIITAKTKSPFTAMALRALKAIAPERGKSLPTVNDDSDEPNAPSHLPKTYDR